MLSRARDAVRALALERLRGPKGAPLRVGLASGEISADLVFRDAVREWVRAGIASRGDHGGGGDHGVTDEAYEHLLALSARTVAGTAVVGAAAQPDTWDFVLEHSRTARRSRAGAFYTPAPLIEWLLTQTLDPAIDAARDASRGNRDAVLALKVCDPACGSGRFLVAAARRLAAALAADRAAPSAPSDEQVRAAAFDVVRSCVVGVDIDDIAVAMCRASLAGLVGGDGPCAADLERHVRVGDSLRLDWKQEFGADIAGRFDVVVGNPPFLNQLQSATAASADLRATLRERFGGVVRGYADAAAAFLLLAVELAGSGDDAREGRVGLVLPRSLLAVEHAGRVRAAVLRAARPTALWASTGAGGFAGAAVATCAVALHVRGARTGSLARAAGAKFEPLAPLEVDADELGTHPSWAHLIADAGGVPRITVRTTRTIADLADATADFRDQYYGLHGFIVDSPEPGGPERRRPRLITSGLIAPLESLWGKIPTRVHKQKWLHPRVDLDAIDAAAVRGDATARMLSAWAKARLVPKLLLATQTRVLEVVVDEGGELLPCVPVITIVPKRVGDLALIASVLSSPAMSAVALTRYAGAGMSADAIKLSAKQVLGLPLLEGELDAETSGRVGAWWGGRAPV